MFFLSNTGTSELDKNWVVVEIFYGKLSYEKVEEYLPYSGLDAVGEQLVNLPKLFP